MREQTTTNLFFLLAIVSFISIILFTGCGGSDFFAPPAIVKLTSAPATPIAANAITQTYDSISAVTPAAIQWKVLNNVGIELKGWSATYVSTNNEPLPTLSVGYQKIFIRTEGQDTGEASLDIYHGGVIDLMRANAIQIPFTKEDTIGYRQVRSILSPITSHVTLFFEDDHKHEFTLEVDIQLEFSFEVDN
ncbi:hypothetical protein ACFL35_08825 [Candidatus Riflebacteria bacterium]